MGLKTVSIINLHFYILYAGSKSNDIPGIHLEYFTGKQLQTILFNLREFCFQWVDMVLTESESDSLCLNWCLELFWDVLRDDPGEALRSGKLLTGEILLDILNVLSQPYSTALKAEMC